MQVPAAHFRPKNTRCQWPDEKRDAAIAWRVKVRVVCSSRDTRLRALAVTNAGSGLA